VSAVASPTADRESGTGAVLSIEDLRVSFRRDGGMVHAVDGLSLTLAPGEIFSVVGESGAGKSLAALSILRLTPKAALLDGRIRFHDRDLLAASGRTLRAVRGSSIAMIYQDPMSALNPVWSVGEQIEETIRRHRGVSAKAARERALEVLGLVRLPNPARVADAYPHELSGGMLQRALIAMALACDPEVLIADEPTTALDVTVQAQVLDLLLRLRAELGLAILIITHDMGVVAHTADRVLVMYAGRAVESGAVADVLTRPAHPYTEALLRSLDMRRPRGRLNAIPGAPPPLGAAPPGCPFHPRCRYAQPNCSAALPPLGTVADREVRCLYPLGGDHG
jgi:peptide/nickel transport system ATP-binding protein